MYIACGLPVIAWSKSAIAKFIIDNNIGICIDSLADIEKTISSLTEKEYRLMKENIGILKNRIKNGYYIKNVINEISKNLYY